MNKENIAATPTFTRKRAKSFSTPPTAKPAVKSARGILKGNNGDDAHTIAFIPIHSPSKKRTESAERRRKSLSRRVSFASHASVRLFEKPGESPPQTTPRRSNRLSPAKSPIRNTLEESPTAKSPGLNLDAEAGDSDEADGSNDELTMDLTNIVPRQVFGTRLTNPLSAATPMSDEDSSDSDADDFDGAHNHEDDTAAMDLTDILPPSANRVPASPFPGTPRQSRLPIRVQPSPRAPVYDDNEADQTMDMTRAIGSILPAIEPASPFVADAELDDGMDMTRVIGGIVTAAPANGNSTPSRTPSSPRKLAQSSQGSRSLIEKPEAEDDGDQTVNMDETRIFNLPLEHRRQTLGNEEPTSHTSYTVATEEDETQRLCEGSVTQADGFTQNMDLTRVLQTHVKTAHALSPVKLAHAGFSWGSAPVAAPQEDQSAMDMSMADVSMADVTQNDESIAMDMTRAVPTSIVGRTAAISASPLVEQDLTVNMDLTRTVSAEGLVIHNTVLEVQQQPSPASVLQSPSSARPVLPTTPQHASGSVTRSAKVTPKSATSAAKSSLKRRLSSGAIRTPIQADSASPIAVRKSVTEPSTPEGSKHSQISRQFSSAPRRASLLDTKVPAFGTPESKVLLDPGSSRQPQFGSGIVDGQDLRMSLLKEKIQSMTPRKSNSNQASEVRDSAEEAAASGSPVKKARFMTPQKTPQRSLLAPTASVSRTSSMTPARTTTETPLPPITLDSFLNTTGISFLTGLSTTRRRETFVLPPKSDVEAEPIDAEAAAIVAQSYTVPMLEMYQHACRELTRYITEGRAMCTEIESDMNDQNPEIFDQYRTAGASEKRDLEAKFKALKTMSRLSAKGVWYVWRENLLSGVLVPLKKNLAELEQQSAKLDEYEKTNAPIFAQVQQEYEELKRTADALVREEDQYEAFDHEEAARLQQSIDEAETDLQSTLAETELLRKRDAEMTAEIEALEVQYEKELAEVTAMEAEAEKMRGYTDSEIDELKIVYQSFIDRTGLKVVNVDDKRLLLSLADTLHISISLATGSVDVSSAAADDHQVIRDYYLSQMRQSLQESATRQSTQEALEFVRQQWAAVSSLVAELSTLESVYPVSIDVNEDDNVQATTTVLLPASRTKFLVKFVGTPQLSIDDCALDVSVEVKYGGLDGARVQQHVQSRLHSQAQQRRSQGWLLESLRMPEGL